MDLFAKMVKGVNFLYKKLHLRVLNKPLQRMTQHGFISPLNINNKSSRGLIKNAIFQLLIFLTSFFFALVRIIPLHFLLSHCVSCNCLLRCLFFKLVFKQFLSLKLQEGKSSHSIGNFYFFRNFLDDISVGFHFQLSCRLKIGFRTQSLVEISQSAMKFLQQKPQQK